MSDFKVDAKTKILRFKEQHNRLCDAVDEIPNIIDTAISVGSIAKHKKCQLIFPLLYIISIIDNGGDNMLI